MLIRTGGPHFVGILTQSSLSSNYKSVCVCVCVCVCVRDRKLVPLCVYALGPDLDLNVFFLDLCQFCIFYLPISVKMLSVAVTYICVCVCVCVCV